MSATDLFEKTFGPSRFFIDKKEAIEFANKYATLKHDEYTRKKEIFQSEQFTQNLEERRNTKIYNNGK